MRLTSHTNSKIENINFKFDEKLEQVESKAIKMDVAKNQFGNEKFSIFNFEFSNLI